MSMQALSAKNGCTASETSSQEHIPTPRFLPPGYSLFSRVFLCSLLPGEILKSRVGISFTRLCFQHLCLPFRPLPCLTWPITCGNSSGQNDPTLPRLPHTLLPFRKQSPVGFLIYLILVAVADPAPARLGSQRRGLDPLRTVNFDQFSCGPRATLGRW